MTDIDGGTDTVVEADWQRRVVGRSLKAATRRSIDRGASLVQAATRLLERSNGDGFTVQDVADEAGQSLRTLYQYFESKDDLLLAVYEEAMRTYAEAIRVAIADLDDPLERLAGGVLASLRMSGYSDRGVERGLSRLRATLGQVEPQLIARSQQPLTAVFSELVVGAGNVGVIRSDDLDGSTWMLLALKAAFVTSQTVGNDYGAEPPDVAGAALFALRGLGADPTREWLTAVDERLRMPDKQIVIRPAPDSVPARRSGDD